MNTGIIGQNRPNFSVRAIITIAFYWIYYTCSKTRLTENVLALTPALTLTLTVKRNNVFGLTSFFDQVYRYPFYLSLKYIPSYLLV